MENSFEKDTNNYPLPAPEIANMPPLLPDTLINNKSETISQQSNIKSEQNIYQGFDSSKKSNLKNANQNNNSLNNPSLDIESGMIFKINH